MTLPASYTHYHSYLTMHASELHMFALRILFFKSQNSFYSNNIPNAVSHFGAKQSTRCSGPA